MANKTHKRKKKLNIIHPWGCISFSNKTLKISNLGGNVDEHGFPCSHGNEVPTEKILTTVFSSSSLNCDKQKDTHQTYRRMLLVALPTRTLNQNQSKCLRIGERVKVVAYPFNTSWLADKTMSAYINDEIRRVNFKKNYVEGIKTDFICTKL